jgi:hypothetical protein
MPGIAAADVVFVSGGSLWLPLLVTVKARLLSP